MLSASAWGWLVTSEELKAHMEKVESGGVVLLSDDERTAHIFARWGHLLALLAESERKDRESEKNGEG